MALVGSQSRWPRQQHASLWWLLWKWSGTIIIPSMIYCRNCSQPGSVFIPTDSPNLINGRNTSTQALGVCRIAAKPRITASPYLLHIPLFHFIYLSTEQNLPVCPVGFQRMKEEVCRPYQLPATTQFPLRCHLRPSDVNLCGDGSGKINSADTFKDYSKKSGIPQGRQMGVFIVQMWQLMIDCSDTVRVKTYSNRWAEKYCTSPGLGCLLNWVITWFSVFTVEYISLLIKMCWKAFMKQT